MATDMKMISREHNTMLQAAAAPVLTACKHQNCKALYTRRNSPACVMLLSILLLFLCFSANKLLYITYKRETARTSLEDLANPCLIRASSYDQLQPFVPTENSLLLPAGAAKAGESPPKGIAGKPDELIINDKAASSAPTRSRSSVSSEACQGKLIYTYPLPRDFNEELMQRCNVGYKRYCDKWYCIPCNRIENHGFGPKVPVTDQNQSIKQQLGRISEGVELIPHNAWFRSDQFSLEVIFYEKMKRYRCVTEDPEEASAFYIPYMGGLDMAFTQFSNHIHLMDELQQHLLGWLSGNPVWQRVAARAPHFMVLGHVAWDFDRRPLQGDSDDDGTSSYTWGSSLFHQPLLHNLTWLLIERRVTSLHDMALPFPTLFHPSSPSHLFLWQEEIRRAKRPWLVTFVGGSRRQFDKEATRNVRQVLMRQCQDGEQHTIKVGDNMLQRCKALECIGAEEMRQKRQRAESGGEDGNILVEKEIACDEEPEEVLKALAKSVFCMQPKGDSATRKGFFDTIVAGCIPVLFANETAYQQYLWHLPTDPALYSIFIPEADIVAGLANVVETLSHIPYPHIRSMQRTIRHLIPRIVYSPPFAHDLSHDAFSIALDSLLKYHSSQHNPLHS